MAERCLRTSCAKVSMGECVTCSSLLSEFAADKLSGGREDIKCFPKASSVAVRIAIEAQAVMMCLGLPLKRCCRWQEKHLGQALGQMCGLLSMRNSAAVPSSISNTMLQMAAHQRLQARGRMCRLLLRYDSAAMHASLTRCCRWQQKQHWRA